MIYNHFPYTWLKMVCLVESTVDVDSEQLDRHMQVQLTISQWPLRPRGENAHAHTHLRVRFCGMDSQCASRKPIWVGWKPGRHPQYYLHHLHLGKSHRSVQVIFWPIRRNSMWLNLLTGWIISPHVHMTLLPHSSHILMKNNWRWKHRTW